MNTFELAKALEDAARIILAAQQQLARGQIAAASTGAQCAAQRLQGAQQ